MGWAQWSPEGGRQAPLSPVGGRQAPFFSRDLVANLNKKITLKAYRPMGGDRGGIFEIFQNDHIFLKFLFFKNIKKKKAREIACCFARLGCLGSTMSNLAYYLYTSPIYVYIHSSQKNMYIYIYSGIFSCKIVGRSGTPISIFFN